MDRRAPLLLLLLTAACYRPKPATVPLRTIAVAPGAADAHCLVVFLPGRGDGPEDYVHHGFPEALQRAGSRCAMTGVDSHLGYFVDKSIVTRLHDDIIAPARARGQDVWLVGISLGGLGSLLYTREHPQEVRGLVLLAPYLGEDDVIQDVARSGGLAKWSKSDTDFQRLWLFLKGYEKPDSGLPPLWLGYGRSDRFAEPDGLLAAVLPADRVVTVAGHHTWRTWRKLWDEMLKRGALTPAPLPAPPTPPPGEGRQEAAKETTKAGRR
jgi:pimeloyl-ACP methyl ester carboxylesterase